MQITRNLTRRLLTASLFALSACYPQGKPTAPQDFKTATTLSSPAPHFLGCYAEYCVTNFSSVTAALEPVFAAGPNDISLGEIHKLKPSNIVSANHYLAVEVIPLMLKYDYTELVWENFPSGRQAGTELAEYYRTGLFDYTLSTWFNKNPDFDGVTSVLQELRSLPADERPNLHGAHASDPFELSQLEKAGRVAETINERTYQIVVSLTAQGKKVVTFNGALHNNLYLTPLKENLSFGALLRNALGPNNYVEVDLYILALMNEQPESLIDIENWQSFSPAQGVNRFIFNNGRIALIIPPPTNP